MTGPRSGRTPEYAISPEGLEKGIRWHLQPVIDRLTEIRAGFASAHAEVKAAVDSEAAGWFGGDGNGEVKAASNSFLHKVEWEIQQFSNEQAELVTSLEEYKSMLQGHVNWIRRTEDNVASRFRAIERELDARER